MHRFASSTPEARELVLELEFVWDQIRQNVPSSHNSRGSHSHNSRQPPSPLGGHPPISPPSYIRSIAMTHPEDEELAMSLHLGVVSPTPYDDELVVVAPPTAPDEASGPDGRTPREREWRGRVEKALAKMATEVAALREQLEDRRIERRRAQAKRLWVWLAWCVWAVARHLVFEAAFWGLVILWMRKRGDKRAEEALKVVGRLDRKSVV